MVSVFGLDVMNRIPWLRGTLRISCDKPDQAVLSMFSQRMANRLGHTGTIICSLWIGYFPEADYASMPTSHQGMVGPRVK